MGRTPVHPTFCLPSLPVHPLFFQPLVLVCRRSCTFRLPMLISFPFLTSSLPSILQPIGEDLTIHSQSGRTLHDPNNTGARRFPIQSQFPSGSHRHHMELFYTLFQNYWNTFYGNLFSHQVWWITWKKLEMCMVLLYWYNKIDIIFILKLFEL